MSSPSSSRRKADTRTVLGIVRWLDTRYAFVRYQGRSGFAAFEYTLDLMPHEQATIFDVSRPTIRAWRRWHKEAEARGEIKR